MYPLSAPHCPRVSHVATSSAPIRYRVLRRGTRGILICASSLLVPQTASLLAIFPALIIPALDRLFAQDFRRCHEPMPNELAKRNMFMPARI